MKKTVVTVLSILALLLFSFVIVGCGNSSGTSDYTPSAGQPENSKGYDDYSNTDFTGGPTEAAYSEGYNDGLNSSEGDMMNEEPPASMTSPDDQAAYNVGYARGYLEAHP